MLIYWLFPLQYWPGLRDLFAYVDWKEAVIKEKSYLRKIGDKRLLFKLYLETGKSNIV